MALLVTLSAALASAAHTKPDKSGNPINLGVLVAFTGSGNIIGVPYANGAKLAAHEINQRGGVNGRKVSLDFADNETQPVSGVQAALKLVTSDRVDALLCSCYSATFFPLAEALKGQDIAITNDASSTPVVRTLPGSIITTIPTDDVLGKALADFAYGLGFHSAALLSVNDPYGTAYRSVVGSEYRKIGGKITVDIVANGSLPDYRPEMQRIIESGSNVLLMGTYTADARLQFRQLKQLGWNGIAFKLYPSGTALNKDPEAAGHFFGLESTWLSGTRNLSWQARYRKAYGQDPSVWAAVGYDAVWLNALGVAKAKSTSGKDVRSAMGAAAKQYVGPTGLLKFDKTYVRIDTPLAFYSIVRGEYVQVNARGKVVKPK